MRWLSGILASLALAASGQAAPLKVVTWDLSLGTAAWSTVSPERQRRLEQTAEVLRGLRPEVLLIQDVRDRQTVDDLITLLAPIRYQVIACSAFQSPEGRPTLRDQVAILSTTPALASMVRAWQAEGRIAPEGGFAFAVIRHEGCDIGVFSAQLKNNATTGNAERDTQLNILKRELSAAQLIRQVAAFRNQPTNSLTSFLLGANLNTNPDDRLFLSEGTLAALQAAGFENGFGSLPAAERVTRRASGRFSAATFDYLFARGLRFDQPASTAALDFGNHFPVVASLQLPPPVPVRGPVPLVDGRIVGGVLAFILVVFVAWWATGRKRFYKPDNALAIRPASATDFTLVPEDLRRDSTVPTLPGNDAELLRRALAAEARAARATAAVRRRLFPVLARAMKEKLVRRLASDREELLHAQHLGEAQVGEIEERLVRIQSQWQTKLTTYEQRIADLERELHHKGAPHRASIGDAPPPPEGNGHAPYHAGVPDRETAGMTPPAGA